MTKRRHPPVACMACGRAHPHERLFALARLRPTLAERIRRAHPSEGEDPGICGACLQAARVEFVMDELTQERGALSRVEAEIATHAATHTAIAADLDARFERSLTTGQRIANGVARIGGSWPFVIGFFTFLALWIAVNVVVGGAERFDPYPFILLNLVLSCLAAVQAPIIMMAQNRVAARDRVEADLDFRTNLKAELEIATLHDKVDHLLHDQWDRMVEIQEVQLDLLEELRSTRGEG